MRQRCLLRPRKRKREAAPPPAAVAESAPLAHVSADKAVIPAVPPPTPPSKGKAYFVLENAAVKKGLVKKKSKILNAADDAVFLQRQEKNLDDFRPDILYEALHAIQDSPIYKVGMVGGIFVKIANGDLFEVKPHVRLPRTLERFCGILIELLEKSSVRAKDTNETLLRIVQEPVTRYLPANSHTIGLSYNSEKVVEIEDYVSVIDDDLNLVFVVGAMVRGQVSKEGTHDYLSVSNYPLGTKYTLRLICEALREKWKVF